jgi:hypothetical protein
MCYSCMHWTGPPNNMAVSERERERESYAQPGLGRPVTGVWVKGGPVCNRALP